VYFSGKFPIPRSGKIPRYNPQSTTIREKYHDTTHTRHFSQPLLRFSALIFQRNGTLFLSRFHRKTRGNRKTRARKFVILTTRPIPPDSFSRDKRNERNPVPIRPPSQREIAVKPAENPCRRKTQQPACFSRFPAKFRRISRRAQHQSCAA
jgi:hypothetical protein